MKIKKTKRIKLIPLPKLIKQTDKLVSEFVRARDKRCVTPSEKCTGVLQCSHLIKRGKMATRFDLMNCNAQCSHHNYLHNYEPEHYTNWFLRKYGDLAYAILVEKSSIIKKYTRTELENIQTAIKILLGEIK